MNLKVLIFFLLISSSFAGGPTNYPSPSPCSGDTLCAGECLRPGQDLSTCHEPYYYRLKNVNPYFLFRSSRIFGQDIREGTIFTDYISPLCDGSELCMEPSGQLVIKSLNCNETKNLIDPSLVVPGSCVRLFDDGSLWTTLNGNQLTKLFFPVNYVSPSPPSPSQCNDKLCGGQCLYPGQTLYSCDGSYTFYNSEGVYYHRSIGMPWIYQFTPDNCRKSLLCMEHSGQVVVYGSLCDTPSVSAPSNSSTTISVASGSSTSTNRYELIKPNLVVPGSCIQIPGPGLWISLNGVRLSFFP
jgi:hypothetical protein